MNFDAKSFLESLTTKPGVYQMLNAQAEVLYVGKARNLKDRVSSYFRANLLDPKTTALVQQIHHIEITITRNENEALLLESNLIKQLHPKYNILLRDDKSYPYLFLSAHPDFPRLNFHRGPQREKGEYFGPYPSAGAVRETLDLLQKLFKIRQCSDLFFKSRTRPCLQYQIKRCTAPCVGYMQPAEYQIDVQHARLFLQGKNEIVIQDLLDHMESAAKRLAFEQAAHYRDLVRRLRDIQSRQYITGKTGDIDVIALVSRSNMLCIEVMSIRAGRLLGDKSYFPKAPLQVNEAEVLFAFLPQYYLSSSRGSSFPQQILVNYPLPEKHWVEAALAEQLGSAMQILLPKRGKTQQWMRLALLNAQQALTTHLSKQLDYYQWLEALQAEFNLPNLPQRLECFDISHTMGEATVASCVVFDMEGPVKTEYRRFNIKGITPGDDYGAMQQALTRHYTRLKGEGAPLPDMLLIDGGRGQLAKAEAVLEELQVTGIILLGVAKGEGRKPGREKLFRSGSTLPIILRPDSMALHLIQRIRDEAHRFAIAGHRQQRTKARATSPLESIPNVGPKRRRELLRHFGGLQGVMRASVEELAKAPQISVDLAKRIYEFLHG